MLHANLKAVCSPQIASIGGGAGDTGVHLLPIQAYWRNFWVCLLIWYYGLNVPCQQFVLVFVSYSYNLWHKTVLCGTKLSYAFLLEMDGTPSHMSFGQNH